MAPRADHAEMATYGRVSMILLLSLNKEENNTDLFNSVETNDILLIISSLLLDNIDRRSLLCLTLLTQRVDAQFKRGRNKHDIPFEGSASFAALLFE